MKSDYYAQHQRTVQLFKLELQKILKNKIRIFDRHVGLFYTKNGAPIKINQKGMSDLYAILKTSHGLIHLEFEIKTGNARQSKDQKNWEKIINELNGLYFVVRKPKNDALKIFDILKSLKYV